MELLFIDRKTFVQKKNLKSDFCLALYISHHYQNRHICVNTKLIKSLVALSNYIVFNN